MHSVLKHTFKNSVRTILAPLPHLHRVCICVLVNVGSRDEHPGTNGISHFLEHMIFRGNSCYPTPYQLNSAIEAIGGDFYAATHTDLTHYQITLPPENLQAGLEILGHTLCEPTFNNIDIEKSIVRQEILGSLDEHGQDIDVNNLSRQTLFAPHSLSFPIAGTIPTLQSFTEETLKQHHQEFYSGENIIVCLTGAIDPHTCLPLTESAFASLPPGQRQQRSLLPDSWRGSRWNYLAYDDSQSDLRVCFDCPGELDSTVVALQLLARILDDGMSTRLHRVLCEQKGLVYDVFGALELFQERGVYDIGVSIEQSKVPVVVEAIIELLQDLRHNGLIPGELETAQRRSLWDLQTSVDHAEETAFFLATRALLGKQESLDELKQQIAAVTPKDIMGLVNTIFTQERLHAVCIGRLGSNLEARTLDALERL